MNLTNSTLPLVIDAIVKAALILAVTALVAGALRRASASVRHFVWALGLLSALAAPLLSFALPRWELPIVTIAAPAVPAPAAALETSTRAAVDAITAPLRARRTATAASTTAAAPPVTRAQSASLPSWPAIALMIWAAGALTILGRMVLGLLAVQWMSRRTPEVTAAPWLEQARSLAAGLGLSRVRFLRGRAGTMPMAWGIARAAVLVPADADSWPAHRIRVVLLHELAHVKRRDCLTHLVAQLACAAYWFNPLVWMAARRLRTERERACDDLVLAAGTRGSDYADQLLDIARVMQAGRFPAVFAGASLAMAHRSQLEGRLIAILDPSVPRRGLSRARAAAAAAVFTAVIVAIASVQPWAEERPALEASIADETHATHAAEVLHQAPAPRPSAPAAHRLERDSHRDAERGRITRAVVDGELRRSEQSGENAAPVVAKAVAGGLAGAVADGVVSGVADTVAGVVAEAIGELHDQNTEAVTTGAKGQVPDPRTVNALMEALKDSDKDVRETAMNVLVRLRDPRMFEPLVAALKDSDADIREQAASALGRMRDARAIDPLAAALKDASASVREQVVFALGQLRAAGTIEAIAMALRDASPSVREQAAFALGQIRDKRAIEPLISALKDGNPSVREQSAFALGQMRAAPAIEALVVALKDVNPDVREQVAFALGRIGDPRAIDGLMAALKDSSASVRRQAAFALGQIR